MEDPAQWHLHNSRPRLRVYSVSPPFLADRAKVFGGALTIKEGWWQTDRGFFDAPGAASGAWDAASLQHDLGGEETSLPPVTMVFAAVEGAKALSRWRRASELRRLAAMIRNVMLAMLEVVPGGYLCREQEAELKYMLAFADAANGLQWCLMVQEALMYAPWPPALLSMPEFAEQHAPGDGTLLFRGPRLKMGVSTHTYMTPACADCVVHAVRVLL